MKTVKKTTRTTAKKKTFVLDGIHDTVNKRGLQIDDRGLLREIKEEVAWMSQVKVGTVLTVTKIKRRSDLFGSYAYLSVKITSV